MLKVGIVGSIGPHKGSKVLYELLDLIKTKDLPIQIVVVGFTDRHPNAFISSDNRLIVTGAYKRKSLCRLLSVNNVDIVLIPSIWPETFCYTCVESLLCGYPVIVFDLGGQGEHVRSTGAGLALTERSAATVSASLMELMEHPESLDSLKTAAKSFRTSDTFLVDALQYRAQMINVLFH